MSGGDSVRLMLMRATCTSPRSSELSERMTRQGLGRGPGDSASSPELCLGTGPQSWVGYSQRRAKIVLGKKRSLFFFFSCILSSWQKPGQITKGKEDGSIACKSRDVEALTGKPGPGGWLGRVL